MTRRELIILTVEDLVVSLLNDDRKNDEELARGSIEDAVQRREITKAEICKIFADELDRRLS